MTTKKTPAGKVLQKLSKARSLVIRLRKDRAPAEQIRLAEQACIELLRQYRS